MSKKHKHSIQKKQNSPKKEKAETKKETTFTGLKQVYIKEYKKLFLIPIVLAILSFFILLNTYNQTGEFMKRDVTLKGGISLTINVNYADVSGLEEFLKTSFPESSLNVRTIESRGTVVGIIIEASDIGEQDLLEKLEEKISLEENQYSLESMGSSLGESFFKQMFIAVLVAFVGMGLVFQFYFRNIYATFAALFSAFLDIFITIGFIDLMDIRLTAGGIAAYLMLIGYSIDTSILLSTKLLKESTEIFKGLFNAMKTGLTMSAAGIAATGISYLLTNNVTLKQIMLILIVGLLVDVITTWIGNVAFLRYYLEKKNGKA